MVSELYVVVIAVNVKLSYVIADGSIGYDGEGEIGRDDRSEKERR